MQYLVLFIVSLSSFIGFSQSITLSGYIKDANTREVLIGATVYDLTTKNVVVSNEYGFYSLELPLDTLADISVSYIGYKQEKKFIACLQNQVVDFNLQTDNQLEEIIIIANKEKPIQERLEMSVVNIPIKQINKLPALGGETDIIKALQLMPGVQSGNEGSSHLFVRGGSYDQNLVLLDDVSMYYVNHLGGFVSVFNTDAIKNVNLIKGGFPARYGSRLSSVVDIRMKDGNSQKKQRSAMIGLIAAKISLEGPIKKDTSSYIISTRRMLYDLYLRPSSYFKLQKKASIGYYFYDFNAKINHRFSNKSHLFFSVYLGDDKLGLTSYLDDAKAKNNTRWGNKLGAFRYNYIFNQKLFSNTTLSYTRYRFETKNVFNEKDTNSKIKSYNVFNSAINDLKLKSDFSYYLQAKYKINFGIEGIYHSFKPGVTSYKYSENNQTYIDTIIGNNKLKTFEGSLYFENEFSLGKHLSANMGMRYNIYKINHHHFHSVEPRILINALLTKSFSIKTSYSKMQQNVHLLTSTGMGMPVDLWLPATEKAIPETSKQWALGIAKTINKKYELSIEGYYKKMENLITYKEGSTYQGGATDWQDKIENNGKGTAYGIEFLLQKKIGRTTGWVGYTWSKNYRTFININQGKKYPFKYDRRHDISIVLNHKLKENIDFSSTWMYGTGNAYTLAIGRYEVSNNLAYNNDYSSSFEDIYIYDGKNNERMRDFHRLDIGFNFHKQLKKGKRIWNISILNVYNRQNPYFYYFDNKTKYGADGELIERKTVLKQQSLFPIIPSISYSFKF